MTTLCIWIPSLSSPDWYFCNSDFLVLISLFGITIILWISLLYYAHLIFGFEIGLNKQLRFCLALVCTWFLFPDVTLTGSSKTEIPARKRLVFFFILVDYNKQRSGDSVLAFD